MIPKEFYEEHKSHEINLDFFPFKLLGYTLDTLTKFYTADFLMLKIGFVRLIFIYEPDINYNRPLQYN